MARTEIPTKDMDGDKAEELRARLASAEGVRSVDAQEGRLVVDHDEALIDDHGLRGIAERFAHEPAWSPDLTAHRKS